MAEKTTKRKPVTRLVQRISNVINRVRGRSTAKPTTGDEMLTLRHAQPAGQLNDLSQRFRADQERRAVEETCRRMYKADPRAKGVIQTLARDAVRGGAQVTVADNQKAEDIATEMIERLKLNTKLDDWMRLSLRDGDSFLECSIDTDMLIRKITRKPTLTMHRNSNEYDEFDNPFMAYWWGSQSYWGGKPPENAVWFTDWQIVHARWDHEEGGRYGNPLFSSSTGPWKKMREGEIDMSIRRKTRAGMKYVHSLTDLAEGSLKAYREANKDVLNDPFAAVADYFIANGSITAIQGDAQLGNIDDVMHHIRTWWLSSPIPMSLLGYGQDLNRDVLQEQQEQYKISLETITEWVEAQLLVPFLERQWLIQGIDPVLISYSIEWQAKQLLTVETVNLALDLVLKMRLAGWPENLIYVVMSKFLPGINFKNYGLGLDNTVAVPVLQPPEEEEVEKGEEEEGETKTVDSSITALAKALARKQR